MITTSSTILIVEDEHLVALELEAIIEELGHRCAGHAANAADAVSLCDRVRPDLVLMDINLGQGVDGVDAAATLRERQDVPIVFVTAYDDDETLNRARITEPYGYVLKPFRARDLRVCIHMALHHHAMQREREQTLLKLQRALDENRAMEALLTSCCQCQRVKDETHGWIQLSNYLQIHHLARLSHGYCPDCAENQMRALRQLGGGGRS